MRLYRPYVPVEVKCRVLLRQIGEIWIDEVLEANRGNLGDLLIELRGRLAALLDCPVSSLQLDHDPPLGARVRLQSSDGKCRTIYRPAANDPEHLVYRVKEAHRVKTLVRGDHGQFSDLALIRREKKRGRPPKPKRPWPKRSFPKRREA